MHTAQRGAAATKPTTDDPDGHGFFGRNRTHRNAKNLNHGWTRMGMGEQEATEKTEKRGNRNCNHEWTRINTNRKCVPTDRRAKDQTMDLIFNHGPVLRSKTAEGGCTRMDTDGEIADFRSEIGDQRAGVSQFEARCWLLVAGCATRDEGGGRHGWARSVSHRVLRMAAAGLRHSRAPPD